MSLWDPFAERSGAAPGRRGGAPGRSPGAAAAPASSQAATTAADGLTDARAGAPGGIVLDSSALIALLLEEERSVAYLDTVLAADTRMISAFNLLETAIVAEARKGWTAELALESLCSALGIDVMPVTPEQANLAADAWRRFGEGRHEAQLNPGDCCAYALARSTGFPLLADGDGFLKTDVAVVTVETAN